jgi:hypothetical protein
MAKNGKPESKPLFFVDTNIYLNAYRARGESGLLKHIESVADLLIVTDQVEFEFLNNRRDIINESLAAMSAPTVKVPSYLIDSRAANSVARLEKQIGKQVKALTERFEGFLKEPAKKDPALKIIRRLMNKESFSLKAAQKDIQEQIIEAAILRHRRNFPPRKPKNPIIGDAVNWEWIVYCGVTAHRDVILVAEDSDFHCEVGLLDWLAEEFTIRTKCKARLVRKLSEALKMLHVRVTPQEEKEEAITAQQPKPNYAGYNTGITDFEKRHYEIKQHGFTPILSSPYIPSIPPQFPEFWPALLARLRLTESKSKAFDFINRAYYATHRNNEIKIYFQPGIAGALSQDIPAIDGILKALADLGLASCSVAFEPGGYVDTTEEV